ncbi:hypothetical protein BKA70DRAFT_1271922, partial [Coprinopsis sp. MPI-PUGE-AT-0042]
PSAQLLCVFISNLRALLHVADLTLFPTIELGRTIFKSLFSPLSRFHSSQCQILIYFPDIIELGPGTVGDKFHTDEPWAAPELYARSRFKPSLCHSCRCRGVEHMAVTAFQPGSSYWKVSSSFFSGTAALI